MTTIKTFLSRLVLLPFACIALSAHAADSLKFSETLRQVAVNGVATEQGRVSASARLSLAGVDTSGFDAGTAFEIYVGAFHFAATLGDDSRYTPGRTGAQFSANGLSAQLSWSAQQLNVSISAATPSANQSALAETLLGFPGPIQTNVLGSVNFAGVSDQFVLLTSGRVVLKNGLSSAELTGSGLGTAAVPPGPTHTLAQGQFQVDATTGQVTVGTAGGDVTSRSKRARFTGSTIVFNSSQLLNQGGDVGRRVMNVSLTNRAGEPIGALPNGATTGLRVLFGPFTNVGAFTTDLRSQTTVSTLAGTGASGSADGANASATFNQPFGAAVDGSGNVYVTDFSNNKIRKISNGFVSTLAGNGLIGAVNGIGTAASFNSPFGIALNPVDGALIVAELNGNRIRRITTDGRVTTIAGIGTAGSTNGLGSAASFAGPTGVAVDSTGIIYVTERGFGIVAANRIRKIVFKAASDPTLPINYTVSTLAGGIIAGSTDGVGIAAKFFTPLGITVTADGTLYVADSSTNKIRRISKAGEVVSIAGTGTFGSADGSGATATFSFPIGIVFINGALFVSETGSAKIRQLTLQDGANPSSPTSWRVATVAGTGAVGSTDGAGNVATFNSPKLLAADAAGNLYVPDASNNKIRKIVPTNGFFPIGAANGSAPSASVQLSNADGVIPNQGAGANLPFISYAGPLANGATSALQPWAFIIPTGVGAFEFTATVEANTSFLAPPFAVDNSATPGSGAGSPKNDVRTRAGSSGGFSGFINGVAAAARFSSPKGVAADARGNVYVGDTSNQSIRRISADGIVSTVAGVVGAGTGSTDGTGDVANFNNPGNLAVSADGTVIYVADSSNHRIRRIELSANTDRTNPINWTVSTIAGSTSGNTDATTGDLAKFNTPFGIALDAGGNVYVSEFSGNRVRRMQFLGGDPNSATSWFVKIVAGDSAAGSGTTDATGTAARFSGPASISVDRAGNIYVADQSNHRIRKITPDGVTTTLAGSSFGYTDAAGAAAQFNNPDGIAVDSAGYIYVSDFSNNRIRRVSPDGVVETVAGTGAVGNIDGSADVATFSSLQQIAVDAAGNLYVLSNNAVRLIQRSINSSGP